MTAVGPGWGSWGRGGGIEKKKKEKRKTSWIQQCDIASGEGELEEGVGG